MYTKYGDVKKAQAHMGRAMRYYRTRFGVGWDLDPDGAWTLSRVRARERMEDSLEFTFTRKKETKKMIVRGLADNYLDESKMQYTILSPINLTYTSEQSKAFLPSFLAALIGGVSDTDGEAKITKTWKEINEATGSSEVYHGDPKFTKRFSNLNYTESRVMQKLLRWNRLEHEGADYGIQD